MNSLLFIPFCCGFTHVLGHCLVASPNLYYALGYRLLP
uniref:Uncharacterized protein n=1 Tax=Anguilla anguilla TaxID=7936 RepID=A0A0E9UXY6_ANGAN